MNLIISYLPSLPFSAMLAFRKPLLDSSMPTQASHLLPSSCSHLFPLPSHSLFPQGLPSVLQLTNQLGDLLFSKRFLLFLCFYEACLLHLRAYYYVH